jgi:glycosyltransferase involved in cell wall biosynthesis
MRVVYLTAGAAGMYCGSCLHDNALAKALIGRRHDVLLTPTYTPILTDEESVSGDQLFYGGLNVYLQQSSPLFRWTPNWMDRWLSSPRLVGWIASRAMGTSAKRLGAMTVSMLKGRDGFQNKEVRRLCEWLETLQPDVVVFSNLLIAGCIEDVQQRVGCPVAVILQGDDIFFEQLIEPYREQALNELRRLAGHVDRFIVHSRDYGRRMQAMLGFDGNKLRVSPLSIDTSDFLQEVERQPIERAPRIGYLARLAPEKGLHVLIDAFIALHDRQLVPDAQLEIAGWLGKQHEPYWHAQEDKLRAAGLGDFYRYAGSVDRAGKLEFLRRIDVLSVPTTYQEPKGLFLLEGLAAGVPYIQPSHGAFPEMHKRAAAGHLFHPERPEELADRLHTALADRQALRELGQLGRKYVLEQASTECEAERMEAILSELLTNGTSK